MARPGLTYDQIAQAADALVAQGTKPTLENVRAALGSGSNSTIHTALKRWRELHPATPPATPELPSILIRDIGAELERVAAEARAGIEKRLLEAQSESDRLAADNQAMEAERDGLEDLVARLKVERDQAVGQALERSQEIQRLADLVTREQAAAEAARLELAKAQVRMEAEAAMAGELRDQVRRLEEQLAAERARTQELERNLVQAQTQLQGERTAKEEALGREQGALERERSLQRKVDDAQAKLDAARTETARQLAEAQAAAEKRVGDAQRTMDQRVTEVQAANDGRIAEAHDKIVELEKGLLEARGRTVASETRASMLEAQVVELKGDLTDARASLDDARRYYQQRVAGASATKEEAKQGKGGRTEALISPAKSSKGGEVGRQ